MRTMFVLGWVGIPNPKMDHLSIVEEFDIDLSILRQVKITQDRLAEFTKCTESNHVEDDVTLQESSRASSLELLGRQCRDLQDQLSSLESEIRLLEDETRGMEGKRRRRVLDELELEETILSLIGGAVGNPVTLAGKEALLTKLAGVEEKEGDNETWCLRSQIKLNEALSGIKLLSVDWELKRKDRASLLREHTHVGSSHGHSFMVIFVVRYVKADDGDTADDGSSSDDLRIISLKVEVEDPKIQEDMEAFLSRASLDCDVMSFYQTFSTYCVFHENRNKTFQSIKSQFNNLVHLSIGPDGHRLRFSIQRGISLNFTWDVTVSVHGLVQDRVTVQTKTSSNAPGEVLEMMSGIPQLLDKMMFVHGAKDGLLQLFLLFKPKISTEP